MERHTLSNKILKALESKILNKQGLELSYLRPLASLNSQINTFDIKIKYLKILHKGNIITENDLNNLTIGLKKQIDAIIEKQKVIAENAIAVGLKSIDYKRYL